MSAVRCGHDHPPRGDNRPLSVKLLNGTLELHDVKDVEATCRSILDRALLSRNVSYLDPHEYEDALTFFVNTAYEFSLRYDPERVRNEDGSIGMSFSTYLHRFLPSRLADWYRQRFVDIRYVAAPTLVGEEHAEFEEAYSSRHSWGAGGDSSSFEEVLERGVLVATVQTYSLAEPGSWMKASPTHGSQLSERDAERINERRVA